MPTIKTINRSVQERNAPSFRSNLKVSGETFAPYSGMANAAQSLGDIGFEKIKEYQNQQKAARDARIQELENNFSAQANAIVHTPQTGLINTKGKNAFGVSELAEKEFNKIEESLVKELDDDDLINSFRQKVFTKKAALKLQLQGHESNQYEKFEEVNYETAMQNSIEDAVNGFNDEGIINLSLQKQFEDTVRYAQNKGLGEEWAKEKINDHTSKTHKAVITRMLNGNATSQAKSYYEKYKEQITGQDKVETEKLIKDGSLKGEAQAIADQVTRGDIGMEDALLKIRGIKDPDLRDEANRRVKLAFNEIQDAKKFESDKALEDASLFVEQNKTVDAIPAQTWQKLDFKDRQTLYKLEAAYKKGENIETDMQTYNDLMLMANNPKLKNEFLKTSMLKYADKLAKPEMKELIKLQADMRSGKKEATSKLTEYVTKRDLINTTLRKAGLS